MTAYKASVVLEAEPTLRWARWGACIPWEYEGAFRELWAYVLVGHGDSMNRLVVEVQQEDDMATA